MTTTMDQIHHIRELFFEQGLNLSDIAEASGFNWKTVRKYVDMEDFNIPSKNLRPDKHFSKLDLYKPTIDKWLKEDKNRSRKQRHTARRVFDRLKEKHLDFDCSYRLVAIYVAEKKKELNLKHKHKDGYLPLIHYPGEAQLDFGEAEYVENGLLCTGKYLTITCPHSNGGYIQLFPSENMECLLEGMQSIFEHMGGAPTEIWFDNTATIVTSIMRGGNRKLTDRFLRFQEHYGFKAKFMNPESGWEKGNVENKVGYLRRNLLVPMPEFSSLEDFNKQLLKECDLDHERSHYLNGKLISELLEEDKKAFKPLPRIEFETARYMPVRTNKYGQFKLHKGRHTYSASPALCEEEICVKLTCVLYIKSTESCREKRRKMQLHLGENCRTCYRLW